MTSSTKIACIDIVDFFQNDKQSYLSWINAFFKRTFFQQQFDVFVSTTDRKSFDESDLNKFILYQKRQGLVRNYFVISFNVSDTDLMGYLKLMSFCQNFREINQGIKLDYSWYYSVSSDTAFNCVDIAKFDKFFESFIDPTRIYFIETDEKKAKSHPLKFFMTGDRIKFSILQNVYQFGNFSGNKIQPPLFFMQKILFKMCDEGVGLPV